MSTTGLNPDVDRPYTKTFHHRNGSAELDVFEAARYFSGDAADRVEETRPRGGFTGGRRSSLDIAAIRNHHHHYTAAEQKQLQAPVKDKKYKQPSSPGGKLASFLNSLFSQSTKKKSKSNSAAAPDDDFPGGARRRRRSSISHFSFGTSNNTDKNSSSVYSVSSKSSGRRSPPEAYDHAPTKHDFRSLSDHKHAVREITKNPESSWLDLEKFRFRDGLSEKKNNSNSNPNPNSENLKINSNTDRTHIFKHDYDEGAESDSSSDLFELQNYDLGDYSTGLPVYESTKPETMNRGAPISAIGP